MSTRRIAIAAVVIGVAVATPAAAAPCAVELVHVPDDVRPVIAAWVAAEPRCAVQLTVRVIRTEGGLYVVASDAAGRIRDRLAPDAVTAAVLIASWVADDGAAAPAAPAVETPAAPAVAAPAAPAVETPAAPAVAPTDPGWAARAAPGMVEPTDLTAPATAPGRRPAMPYVGLGVVVRDNAAGVRAEVDLVRRWHLDLGVAAQWSQSAFFSEYLIDDYMVMAQASRELGWGALHVRASAAAGLVITSVEVDAMAQSMLSPVADLELSAGVRVSRRFELRLGAGVVATPQRLSRAGTTKDRGLDPQVFAGIGYRR